MEETNQEVSFTKEDLTLLYDASASIHAIRDLDEIGEMPAGAIQKSYIEFSALWAKTRNNQFFRHSGM